MKRENRSYSKAFKVEAIWLYETSEKSVRQVEEELGITKGLESFVGSGHQTELSQPCSV